MRDLVTALCKLCEMVLEDASKRKSIDDEQLKVKLNAFGISRLVETVLVNVARVETLWNIVIDEIVILASSRFRELRCVALEAISTVVVELFEHKRSTSERGGERPSLEFDEKWSHSTW